MVPRYIRDIDEISQIPAEEREGLRAVTERYAFYANKYYLNLIDWDDPNDPIRKIIIPSTGEIQKGGSLDPSSEKRYTVGKGIEHKYEPTALILASRACGGVCRFCFRKRIFMPDNADAVPDLSSAYDYLRSHREINNVLLTGGDPLVLPTSALSSMLSELWRMDHLKYIRIGTKIPVYNPYRILEDPTLTDMISEFSRQTRKLYFITDVNHPRELTKVSVRALNMLMESGGVLANQTPLLKGVNDDPKVLADLLNKLAAIGVPPYYVFQCRPTVGNKPFSLPIEKAYRIFEEAKNHLSGLAKRARLIMSHTTGKLEILALTDEHILFRYHNAAHEENLGRILVYRRDPSAHWLDDYTDLVGSHSPDVSYNPGVDKKGQLIGTEELVN